MTRWNSILYGGGHAWVIAPRDAGPMTTVGGYPTGGGRVPRTCVIRTKRTIRVPLVDPSAAGIRRRAVGIVVTLAIVVALSACVPERGESTPDVLQAAWSVKPPAEWGGGRPGGSSTAASWCGPNAGSA